MRKITAHAAVRYKGIGRGRSGAGKARRIFDIGVNPFGHLQNLVALGGTVEAGGYEVLVLVRRAVTAGHQILDIGGRQIGMRHDVEPGDIGRRTVNRDGRSVADVDAPRRMQPCPPPETVHPLNRRQRRAITLDLQQVGQQLLVLHRNGLNRQQHIGGLGEAVVERGGDIDGGHSPSLTMSSAAHQSCAV